MMTAAQLRQHPGFRGQGRVQPVTMPEQHPSAQHHLELGKRGPLVLLGLLVEIVVLVLQGSHQQICKPNRSDHAQLSQFSAGHTEPCSANELQLNVLPYVL